MSDLRDINFLTGKWGGNTEFIAGATTMTFFLLSIPPSVSQARITGRRLGVREPREIGAGRL